MWWALIEDIALHVEKVAGEKEMACGVRGYQVYKDIWQQQLGKCWCVVVGKIFVVKLYSRKIFSYVFCVRKYFYNEKK